MRLVIELDTENKISVYKIVLKLYNELNLKVSKIKWGDKIWTIKSVDDIKFFMHEKSNKLND